MIRGREQTFSAKIEVGRKEGRGDGRIVYAGMKGDGDMEDSNMVSGEKVIMEKRPCTSTFHSEALSAENFDHNENESQQMRPFLSIDPPVGIQVPCVQQNDSVCCGLFVAWFAYNYVSNTADAARIPRVKSSEMKTKGELLGMGRIDLEVIRKKLVGLVERRFSGGQRRRDGDEEKMETDGKDGKVGKPAKNCPVESNPDQQSESATSGPNSRANIERTMARLESFDGSSDENGLGDMKGN